MNSVFKRVGTIAICVLLANSLRLRAQDYSDYSTAGLPGKLYVPTESNDTDQAPFILGLHGGGGIGTDNSRHLVDFSDLLDYAKANRAFLYLPQSTTAFWHVNDRPQAIMEMIDKAIEERNADPDRIYITGFSMGGGGTWDILNLYPSRFAGGIPICGITPRVALNLAALIQTPIWIFHARNDSIVNVTQSRDVIDALLSLLRLPHFNYPPDSDTQTTFEQAVEIPSVNYTEYHEGDHFIWQQIYESDEILHWLFTQKRSNSSTTVSIQSASANGDPTTLMLDIRTSRLTDVSIEKSNDLKTWTPHEALKDIPGSILYDTKDRTGFYRAIVDPKEE